MAFPDGWTRRYEVNPTLGLVNGSHASYVGLITEASFTTNALDIFSNSDNGGGDIRASSDIDGLNQLPIQVVEWDTSGQTGQIFVKTSVNDSTQVPVYIWVGNSGEVQPATTDPFGRNATWDDSIFVHNLYGPTDSTGNEVVLDTEGSGTEIDNSWGGPATRAARYRLQDTTAVKKVGPLTLSCWSNTTNSGTIYGVRDNSNISYQLFRNLGIGTDLQIVGSDLVTRAIPNTPLSQWIRLDVTIDGTDLNIYVDGVLELTATGAFNDQVGVPLRIGYRGAGGLTTVGFATNDDIGLFQARDSIVPLNLLQTEFNNQDAPGSFYISEAGVDVVNNTSVSVSSTLDDVTPSINVNATGNISVQVSDTLEEVTPSINATVSGNVSVQVSDTLEEVTTSISAIVSGNISVRVDSGLDDVIPSISTSVTGNISVQLSDTLEDITPNISTTITGNINVSGNVVLGDISPSIEVTLSRGIEASLTTTLDDVNPDITISVSGNILTSANILLENVVPNITALATNSISVSLDATLGDVAPNINVEAFQGTQVSIQATLDAVASEGQVIVVPGKAIRYPCANVNLCFNRYPASYFDSKGYAVDPEPVVFPTQGSLQPDRRGEMQTVLPEGVTSDSYAIYYTYTKLRDARQRSGTRADDTEINGETYEVFRVYDWTGFSGVGRNCNHYKVLLVRQDINEDDRR